MNKTILNTAVAAALSAGIAAPAMADVQNFSFDGFFTILDSAGVPLNNSSIPAGNVKTGFNNQLQTPIAGTMRFDTTTGAGTAEIDPFEFFSGDPTLLATAVGINMQAIGNGMGGPGTLVLGNMLFNWNTNNGIPVSLVLDAAGFFNGDLGGGGAGATPATDGIYVGTAIPGTGLGPFGAPGYLALGAIPMASTAWQTTANCTGGVDCIDEGTSGILPLSEDTMDSADYSDNTGAAAGVSGIGGTPMLDGPFGGSYANFDITSVTFTSIDIGETLAPNCDFGIDCGPPPVPVPAAVWLFGSGLLGLVGVARRRKVS